jgi:predicted DNA-binding transcriptional regulator AlpA
VHDLLYNVKQIREDVAVPKSPEPEGSPRLMTVTEIAAEHGVSRQTVHTYRRTGVFPSPVEGEGSTRPRFREDEVVAFFKANPKQPRKKRRYPPQQQGETGMKTYVLTMRIEADAEIAPEQIQQEIYDACPDVPFGFDITGIEPKE